MSGIRILVADDHSVVREGLRRVLDAPGFEVVGEAASGAEAIAAAARLKPDVVVLDISMPDGNGLSSIRPILDASPSSRVLMLSVYQGGEYVKQAITNGAHGYVLKDTTPGELRRAIQTVHEGQEFFSESASKPVGPLVDLSPPGSATTGEISPDAQAAVAALTSREREVLALIAAGHSNKEAASALGISPRTVESHRDSVMRKLGVRNAAGLTRIALESGLVG